MESKYNNINYIGRFNPFHKGHLETVKKAAEMSVYVTLIVGSTGVPATSKNPLSFKQRKELIKCSLGQAGIDLQFIRILDQRDYKYNEPLWTAEVLQKGTLSGKNGIIGHNKDESSYYLSHFKEWEYINMDNVDNINATDIRKAAYEVLDGEVDYQEQRKKEKSFEKYVVRVMGHDAGTRFIWLTYNEKNMSDAYEDWKAIEAYKKSWSTAPFPPVFVTGDAVCIQGHSVLLIQRGDYPGKGLWALPGGFLDQGETLKECIIRELMEETDIDVPRKVLVGSMQEPVMFDSPDRSLRGRSITHAALITLDDSNPLPRVKGSDDAQKAWWHSIAEIPRNQMFEDHYDILTTLLKLT